MSKKIYMEDTVNLLVANNRENEIQAVRNAVIKELKNGKKYAVLKDHKTD